MSLWQVCPHGSPTSDPNVWPDCHWSGFVICPSRIIYTDSPVKLPPVAPSGPVLTCHMGRFSRQESWVWTRTSESGAVMAFTSAASGHLCTIIPAVSSGPWQLTGICYLKDLQDAFWPATAKTWSMLCSMGASEHHLGTQRCLTPPLGFIHQEAGGLPGAFPVESEHRKFSSSLTAFK